MSDLKSEDFERPWNPNDVEKAIAYFLGEKYYEVLKRNNINRVSLFKLAIEEAFLINGTGWETGCLRDMLRYYKKTGLL